jgi:hypothetical protein
MKIFKNIFRRKEKPAPQPLRIEGVPPAPLTPEPDDAELAAQALLEMMSERSTPGPSLLRRGINAIKRRKKPAEEVTTPLHQQGGAGGRSAYYKALAERIRQAHDAATMRTMRFVAFCEERLKEKHLPLEGPGSLGLLNVELMKRIDTIERVGGDLKRRWQHCLAQVLVRLMNAGHADSADNETTTVDTDLTDKDNGSSLRSKSASLSEN